VLDARWTLLVEPSDRLAASRREWIEVPSGDAADLAKRVTALREAVAKLAGRIGDAIAAATSGETDPPTRCPGVSAIASAATFSPMQEPRRQSGFCDPQKSAGFFAAWTVRHDSRGRRLKAIGRPRVSSATEAAIRERLAAGIGIGLLTTAAQLGVGSGTMERVQRELAA
jgi:hypothetical protein